MAQMKEMLDARFERDQIALGASADDIHWSRLTGMSPLDIGYLQRFTANESLLIIIRCPKLAARIWHGVFQPKTMIFRNKPNSVKSTEDGLAFVANGRIMVSDYDLMSVFRLVGPGTYQKIFFSGIDPQNKRSRLTPEATDIIRKANWGLVAPFQHGAQDDYTADDHPNVKIGSPSGLCDRFAAFNAGNVDFMSGPAEAEAYYRRNGLHWPYDAQGKFVRAR